MSFAFFKQSLHSHNNRVSFIKHSTFPWKIVSSLFSIKHFQSVNDGQSLMRFFFHLFLVFTFVQSYYYTTLFFLSAFCCYCCQFLNFRLIHKQHRFHFIYYRHRISPLFNSTLLNTLYIYMYIYVTECVSVCDKCFLFNFTCYKMQNIYYVVVSLQHSSPFYGC